MKLITYLICLFSITSFGDTWGVGSIVQVWPNNNVLENGKPRKEFVVDLGAHEGLTEGQSLTVYRHIPVLSPSSVGPWDSVKVYLGELRVVAVAERSAIARLSIGPDVSKLPRLEYAMFLIGDSVELKSELPIQ